MTYDTLGNPDSVKVGFLPSLILTDYDYDGFAQLVRTVHGSAYYDGEPDGTSGAHEIASADVNMTYYDRLGRRSTAQNGYFETTTFDYDLASRRTGLTDAAGNITTWTYDDLDRATHETTSVEVSGVPTDVHRDFYYNPIGNLVHRVDREGRIVRYEYDDLNQLQSERWYAASGPSSDPLAYGSAQGTINYDYDEIGRLESFDDAAQGSSPASHAVEMSYDEAGRVTDVLQSYAPALGNGVSNTLVGWQYDYDRVGNMGGRTALIDASMFSGRLSGTVDHHDTLSYDGRNQLSEIQRRVGPAADTADAPELFGQQIEIGRGSNGRVEQVSRTLTGDRNAKTLVSDYLYGYQNRLRQIDHEVDNVHQSSYTVSWDYAGRVTNTTGTLAMVNGATGGASGNEQRDFQYDRQGQLAKQHVTRDGIQGCGDIKWVRVCRDKTGFG